MKRNIELIQHLKVKFTQPLPGVEAQLKMSHAVRKFYRQPPGNAKTACVLVLLYLKNNENGQKEWNLVLIERVATNVKDKHKGQISFPGGKMEKEDDSYTEAALREAEEEVGINSKKVEVLGQLTELYIPVSNFLVYPIVGCLAVEPLFAKQESEVETIIEVPLAYLQNEVNKKWIDLKVSSNLVLKNVPYYEVNKKIVWGATAMILSEFLEIIGRTES